jgi:ATP-dependent Clp protease ATP-binding subunit ClpA
MMILNSRRLSLLSRAAAGRLGVVRSTIAERAVLSPKAMAVRALSTGFVGVTKNNHGSSFLVQQPLSFGGGGRRYLSSHPLGNVMGGGGGQQQQQKSALEQFTVDLTAQAQQDKLDPIIGRHEEIRRCLQILARRTKNNPILIGEAGVGKTAIAEGLAQRIVRGEVPESMKDKRVLRLDVTGLVSGAM